MDTFTQLIGRWPTKSDLATDCNVDYGVVHQWERRDSIPSPYWTDVVNSAVKRSIEGVSLDVLSKLSKAKKLQ